MNTFVDDGTDSDTQTEQTHGGPEEGRRGVRGEQMQAAPHRREKHQDPAGSAGRHSQRLVMDHNGQSMEEDCTHLYVSLDPCASQQKLTQRCKSTVLQSSFKKKKMDAMKEWEKGK